MSFVLKRIADGKFAKGKPIAEWTDDLQRARVFVTKTTAKNAVPRLCYKWRHNAATPEDFDVVGVEISLRP